MQRVNVQRKFRVCGNDHSDGLKVGTEDFEGRNDSPEETLPTCTAGLAEPWRHVRPVDLLLSQRTANECRLLQNASSVKEIEAPTVATYFAS